MSASSLLPTLHSAVQEGAGSGEVEVEELSPASEGQGRDFSSGRTRITILFSFEALH